MLNSLVLFLYSLHRKIGLQCLVVSFPIELEVVVVEQSGSGPNVQVQKDVLETLDVEVKAQRYLKNA